MGSALSAPPDTSNHVPPRSYHIPSESDVLAVRDTLMYWLPPELVDIILNEAEYWPCISTSCSSSFNLPANGGDETALCCLITPEIPHASRLIKTRYQAEERVEFEALETEVRRRVKRVMFEISSCDQGWGGEDGLTLPYAGSWTWFDVEIWRQNADPSGPPSRGVSSVMTSTARIKPMVPLPTKKALAAAGYHRVEPPSSDADTQSERAWLIQRNWRASRAVRRHSVFWTDDNLVWQRHLPIDNSPSLSSIFKGQDSGVSTLTPQKSERGSLPDLYGCGNGVGFVQSLRAGDRLVVVARAKYPSWENNIHGNVKAEIAYTIV